MCAVLLAHTAMIAWALIHRTQAELPAAHPLVVVELLQTQRIASARQSTVRRPTTRQTASLSALAQTGHGLAHRNDTPAVAVAMAPLTDAKQAQQTPQAPYAPASPPALRRPVLTTAEVEAEAARIALADRAKNGANAAPEEASAAAIATASIAALVPTAAASPASAESAPDAASAGMATVTGADVKSSGEKFALLPSSDLRYDTFFNGAQNESGTLHWRTDGRTYELAVSLPLPFIGTFSYISQGHIDAFGLAPEVYTERHGRRGTDISRFYRDPPDPHIAFTHTPTIVPLRAGAQDRFSMIFQLASLVAGDPQRYRPGVTREFFVVDNDSAENWPIQMIGLETVVRAGGPIAAVHFMRLPRHDGDRRRIDVWLAPSLGWLPVRIMQTEPNGTQVELVYHSGTVRAGASSVVPMPAASAAAADDHPAGSNPAGGSP